MVNPTKVNHSHPRGQSMAEFALALPILLLVIFGLLEVGRAVFMYAAVVNASREAVRYATAYGVDESDVLHVQNCAEIRNTAKRVAFLLPLADENIEIKYDTGPEFVDPDESATGDEYYDPPTDVGSCDPGENVDESIVLACGDRVTVTVTVNYNPIVPIVPMQAQPFSSSSARTYLGIVELSDTPAACK